MMFNNQQGGMFPQTPYNQGYGQMGYNLNPQPTMIAPERSTLTSEEMAILSKTKSGLDLQITEEELLRSKCNHQTPAGVSQVGPGLFQCNTCKERFAMKEYSQDEINKLFADVNNVMHLLKISDRLLPDDVRQNLFSMTALMNKVPNVWKAVQDNITAYMNSNGFSSGGYSYGKNTFNQINNMMGVRNPYPTMNMQPQGQHPYMMNQGTMMQTPQNPIMNQPVQPMNGYSNNMMGMNNNMNQPQYPNMQPQFNPTPAPTPQPTMMGQGGYMPGLQGSNFIPQGGGINNSPLNASAPMYTQPEMGGGVNDQPSYGMATTTMSVPTEPTNPQVEIDHNTGKPVSKSV